jgi:hypothetical protein
MRDGSTRRRITSPERTPRVTRLLPEDQYRQSSTLSSFPPLKSWIFLRRIVGESRASGLRGKAPLGALYFVGF